jgi:uncharacterized protein (TIGR02594 family)
MQELIKIACAEIGVKEIPGQAHNARILQYASEAGFQDVKDDETAWCSIFLSWCCLKAGLKRSTKLNARSWLAVGTVTTQPEPGDIIVYWRKAIESWEGHVGIYMGTSSDGSRCYTLGGNQANMVSISGFDSSKVLGYRRLNTEKQFILPKPPLKKGSKGAAVVQLQDALKIAGFNAGTSDGFFGDKTADALRMMQSQSGFLKIDGVYGAKTKDYLESLLQA